MIFEAHVALKFLNSSLQPLQFLLQYKKFQTATRTVVLLDFTGLLVIDERILISLKPQGHVYLCNHYNPCPLKYISFGNPLFEFL